MRFNGLAGSSFIFILTLVTWAFFDVLSPYFSAILWTVILTTIFNPVKNRLRSALGEHNGLASLITIAITCLIVFIPLTVILSSLTIELNVVYTKLQQSDAQLPEVAIFILSFLPDWAGGFLVEHSPNDIVQIQKKLSDVVLQGGQCLVGSAFLIGRGTFGFTISFGVILYLLFLLLKDGPYLVRQILDSLPLSDFARQHLFAKFVGVTRTTVKGTAVTTLVQGILDGITFAIMDVNGNILWEALMTFLSLVSAVGSAIVWVPAVTFLFTIHQLWQRLFIVGFFVIIVGLVDNILRPLLVGKDTKMPDYLILITTLDGMEAYGINGFVIGPLIVALFTVCWNLFSGRDHEDNVEGVDEAFMEGGENPPDL